MSELKTEGLSELEKGLYQRFQSEKRIEVKSMNQKELGALGKLASRKLVHKSREPVYKGREGEKNIPMVSYWVLKEEEDIQSMTTETTTEAVPMETVINTGEVKSAD